MSDSLTREYFENVYSAHEDPWNFVHSEYESAKYRETLASLPRDRYHKALEIGCSIGVQTAMLASRCDQLLAIDTSEKALERAKLRCEGLGNVEFARKTIPQEYPSGTFDLTVLSEVGYYFNMPDLGRVADRIAAHAEPNGQLLLVHWLPKVHDYPLTGDNVHDYFLTRSEWKNLTSFRREHYRVDLFAKFPDNHA